MAQALMSQSLDELQLPEAVDSNDYSLGYSNTTGSLTSRLGAALHSTTRAFHSEGLKRRRSGRSSTSRRLVRHQRTQLESIDEWSEEPASFNTLEATHQLSGIAICSSCDQVFPRQLDLDHHVAVEHAWSRPGVPRVAQAELDSLEHGDKVPLLTGGKSLIEPVTLGTPGRNSDLKQGRRSPTLPVIRGMPPIPAPPKTKPSIFQTKLSEHHEPRLGSPVSLSEFESTMARPVTPRQEGEDQDNNSEQGDYDGKSLCTS
ncbi:hypothetical protein QQS21_000534 [Conoideocrella luteorostrata]|uniref:C2H2-type domain-containing protein n=1 Tax=Conoideocrella luteorostrata TaxID=1105319 RepID=A0AAJ0G2G4_9HYPO|nr:hypothetical protein QQS21_000534 [Conoideocrella luteorostrata]